MPDPVLVGVEARIAELVVARRPVLEQLVRQGVDRELRALVEAELEQRTNGASMNGHPELTARRCRRCHQEKPPSAYEGGMPCLSRLSPAAATRARASRRRHARRRRPPSRPDA